MLHPHPIALSYTHEMGERERKKSETERELGAHELELNASVTRHK